jgi:hypothetical protein
LIPSYVPGMYFYFENKCEPVNSEQPHPCTIEHICDCV